MLIVMACTALLERLMRRNTSHTAPGGTSLGGFSVISSTMLVAGSIRFHARELAYALRFPVPVSAQVLSLLLDRDRIVARTRPLTGLQIAD